MRDRACSSDMVVSDSPSMRTSLPGMIRFMRISDINVDDLPLPDETKE